jgi:hypothetical protein
MCTRVILLPPLDVPLVRALAERDNLAALIARLPHAIEAGYADRIIGALKPWAAWHEVYPMDPGATGRPYPLGCRQQRRGYR